MIISERDVYAVLADGEFHSGQELARRMGVSRTAVWKHLDRIRRKGAEVNAQRGRGYRLAAPVEMLQADIILPDLEAAAAQRLRQLQILYQTESTNLVLAGRAAGDSIHAHVVLAEYQTGGRGRGTNRWLSGLGQGLCMSLGWHFDSPPRTLTALSLATGVALSRALRQCGCTGIQLKWPNDLLHRGAKLGGILIESRGQLAGPVDVIIGIGINFQGAGKLTETLAREVTDMSAATGGQTSRNRLAALVINHMFRLLEQYSDCGFEAYINDWRELDCMRGRNAVLRLPDAVSKGRVVDIDENGCLVMSVDGHPVKYSSGDLSLRLID
jgi:BirA family biotin operon repressor/biotin-[acetyl-CoA-carboxylase] ligase